jgi:IS1 family transposase
VTLVERQSRCFVAYAVTRTRSKDLFETLVDVAPPAQQYFSDAFATWGASWYPGMYRALPNKSQTYSVEGGNAELRHYLARLARSSRCFSRCLWALTRAVDLFVFAWNARQRFRRKYPKLPAPIGQFLPQLF